ncbi:MAG: hypothetical protein GEV28_03260 [Actinophytocola sp.]|uniref:hypothetical protein n=1 Tax=Actinophytocola sp. TaxID=1872138 RepID=UPI00132CA713|nr:hypothetical protein [Actinophytocola sp.]MPZ79452.1 hypothetical protein [Actinophytocola sp.]
MRATIDTGRPRAASPSRRGDVGRVLSGDVHHVYTARATFPEPVNAAVFQLTCSPVHNKVQRSMRPLFVMAWWRPLAAVLRRLMFRSPHIDPLPVEWRTVSGPYFGNAIATLRTNGRKAEMVVERAEPGPRLVPLTTVALTDRRPSGRRGGDRGPE